MKFETCQSWELRVSADLGDSEVLCYHAELGVLTVPGGLVQTPLTVLFAWVWSLSAPLSAAREPRARKRFLQKAERE